LSETQSGWQVKSNRVMLLVDERCLQPDLVGADRIVPVASVAASRDLDARHQLNVLRRKSPQRLTFIDRLVFTGLYRLAPGVLDALKIVRPETVILGIVPASERIGAGNQDRAVAVQRPRWKSVISLAR
jgi:hypothetical protein